MRYAILLWALASAAASAQQHQSVLQPGGGEEYRLGPGDALDIQVFEVEELSGPAVVDVAGRIRMPLVGEVPAAGLSARELEDALESRYANGLLEDPQIKVAVETSRSQPVSVVGEVAQPGVYQLEGRRRLLEVLAMAGGLTENVGETINITRASGGEQTVSVKNLLTLDPGQDDNPWIAPHDSLRVSRAGVVYVLGAVRQPGGFPIKDQERMTVLRAVSLASGAEKTAAKQKARIIRQRPEGKVDIPIRLGDVFKGKDEDSSLEPNDIVYIPDSAAKSTLNRTTEAIMQMAVGVVIWRR
ncbi:MAG: polysaccharide biosynthesis/export family protein [Bryobacterales bacterium]